MTVPTTNYQNSSTADGVSRFFPFDFALLQESDLDVYADGVLQTSNYIILINDNGIGGNVIFDVAPDAGKTITRQRLVDYVQQVALPTEGNMPEKVLENMVDKCTMQIQQLNTAVNAIGGTNVVSGPVSAVDGAVAVFDGTTGSLLKQEPRANFGDVKGPVAATAGTLPIFSDTTGKLLAQGPALPASGTIGNVVGPASTVDGHLAVFDGATGRLIKDGGVVPSGGGGTPGGGNQNVQFNDSGVFGGSSNLLWDKTNNILSVKGTNQILISPGAIPTLIVSDLASIRRYNVAFDVSTGSFNNNYGIGNIGGNGTILIGSDATAVSGGVYYGSANKGEAKLTAAGTAGKPLLSGGAGAPAFGTLALAGGGTNNPSLAATNWAFAVGDGTKLTDSPAVAASQSVRRNSAGTAWEAFTPGTGSGDVVGPAGGVTDNQVVVYSGTTGKIIKAPPTGLLGYFSPQVRLSGVSGQPFKNCTAATFLYVNPCFGRYVPLIDSSSNEWMYPVNSPISIGLASFPYPFRLYDVYLAWSGSAVIAEMVPWDASPVTSTITGVSLANPAVLTSNNSLAGGELIGIYNITGTVGTDATRGLNGVICKVASRTATNITLETGNDTTGLAYTSGGTWVVIPTTRNTGIVQTYGRPTKSGDQTRLYIGTVFLDSAQQINDDEASGKLHIYNHYNQTLRYPRFQDTTNTAYTYAGSTYRLQGNCNKVGTTRMEIVKGYPLGTEAHLSQAQMYQAGNCFATTINKIWANAYGINSIGATNAIFNTTSLVANTIQSYNHMSAVVSAAPFNAGMNFIQAVESSADGTTSFTCNSATGGIRNQLRVTTMH